jgi:hypothetical protein
VRQIEFDAGTAVHIGVECAEVCAPRLAILWPGFDTRKRHRFTCGLCRGLPKPANAEETRAWIIEPTAERYWRDYWAG